MAIHLSASHQKAPTAQQYVFFAITKYSGRTIQQTTETLAGQISLFEPFSLFPWILLVPYILELIRSI